nr:uncharacterized protein LOC112489123 [Ipomoea batatas]
MICSWAWSRVLDIPNGNQSIRGAVPFSPRILTFRLHSCNVQFIHNLRHCGVFTALTLETDEGTSSDTENQKNSHEKDQRNERPEVKRVEPPEAAEGEDHVAELLLLLIAARAVLEAHQLPEPLVLRQDEDKENSKRTKLINIMKSFYAVLGFLLLIMAAAQIATAQCRVLLAETANKKAGGVPPSGKSTTNSFNSRTGGGAAKSNNAFVLASGPSKKGSGH